MHDSQDICKAFATSFLHSLPYAAAWSFRFYPILAIVWLGALFVNLIGCGGGEDTTVELNMPAEQCIPGHHMACWCENGTTGHQACRDDGMAYGHCQCPEVTQPTADAGTEASPEGDAASTPDAEADAGLNQLRVWMASEPTSTEVKHGDKNVPVLGLTVQAFQTSNDIHISAIGIACRASINGEAYKDTDCWRRVNRVEILDENGTQLSAPDMPDMVAGKIYYAVNYTVQKDQIRSLLVRADFSDNASDSEPFDKVSFDLAVLIDAEKGIATDDAEVVVGHGFGLNQQGEEPKVEFTIVPNKTQPDGCGPNQPVGHVIGSNCCSDNSTGYMVCQADGSYEGCYGCPDMTGFYPAMSVNVYATEANSFVAGNHNKTIARLEICAFKNVRVKTLEFYLGGNGKTQGSNSTNYFSNNKLQNSSFNTFMGPAELSGMSSETENRRLTFNDEFFMSAGFCHLMYLQSDLAESEDAPSEFIGKNYIVQLIGLNADVLFNNGQLDHAIEPNDVMWNNTWSQQFSVLCNPGTYNPCDCGGGNLGQAICGVNYETLACNCS